MVKTAKHKRSGESYAVKIMDIAHGEAADEGMSIEEIADEIRLTMTLCNKPNIVKIYDFYQTKTHVYLIMELLTGGELLEGVMKLGSYGEEEAAKIMRQLFTGLEGIHAKSMAHRDLKLENLILAKKGDIGSLRIADFGLAKKMKSARGKLSAQCGSPAYVAPEIIKGEQYTPAVDMWSSGCIMYALLCGELPFYEDDEQAMFRRIAKGRMHPPPEKLSPLAMDLLSKLLCTDSVKRLTATEALEHEWVTQWMSNKKVGEVSNINLTRIQRFAESNMGSDLVIRYIQKGDLLIKQGERAKEVYLIKEGSCEVVLDGPDGQEIIVAERHAGEFVGEMGVRTRAGGVADAKPDTHNEEENAAHNTRSPRSSLTDSVVQIGTLLRVKNVWVGGRRGANVRATTDMKVAVMSSQQMQWILEHDYGVNGEMTQTIQERKAKLEKSKTMMER